MKLKVYVRLRPTANEEKNGIVKPEHRLMYLTDPSKHQSHEFVFDRVFDASSVQEDVFEEVGRPLVDHVLQGFNACCLAYGQTGSGKSYSMFGPESGEQPGQRGIIPRCAERLFAAVAEATKRSGSGTRFSVFVSFLEIYLEQVRDLGQRGSGAAAAARPGSGSPVAKRCASPGSSDRNNLEIYEDPSGMTLVKDLTFIEVSSSDDVLAVVKAGYDLRQVAATAQNEASSRSHTLFTISVVQYQDGQQPITGRLHLVDLAGSERLSKSHSEGARLTESKAINTSLTALGKVVMTLAAHHSEGTGAASHVPFRDSKLTRLLKDSLQGNCYTSVLAALNPDPSNYDECFNTLQFALRCQSINTAPHVSSVGVGAEGPQDTAMDQLMQQVGQLQQELELTHAHYQKLIDSVAGPGSSGGMGTLERSEGGGLEGAGSSDRLLESSGSAAAAARAAATAASGAVNVAALDVKLRRLEAQVAASTSKLIGSEARLASKRTEAEEFRERMMSKDYSQVNEMKRLREQVNQAKASLQEAQGVVRQREEEAQRSFDEECLRLNTDNEALRAQLASMSLSVNSMMEARSSKALAAKQQREALVGEAERRLKQQVALTVSEKDRQLDNLRQQSSYHLTRKSEEISTLREQLGALRARSDAEVGGLTAETEYLADYAEKVTEVLRRLEAGVYAVVERGGLRQFKVPQRDKPAPLQADRLKFLSTVVDGVDELVAATSAASAMPAPGISPSSISPSNNSTFTTPRIPPAAPASGGVLRASGGGDLNSSETNLEVLKARWEASYREAITHQVVSDLKGEKTVEYIRSLESQVARCRQDLHAMKKQGNGMTVALRSVQRAHSRPDSAINQAISGQVVSRPPTWGLGHASSTHIATSGTYGRPYTASATMKAGPGGVDPQMLSSSGAWGLGSGGRSNSVGSSANGGYIRENGMSY